MAAHRDDPSHPAVSDTEVGYGLALMAVGRHKEALAALDEATRRATETYGPDAMRVGFFLAYLSAAQVNAGLIREGIASARHSLSIYERDSEPGTVNHASRERVLGAAYLAAGDARQALAHFDVAIDMITRGNYSGTMQLTRAQRGLALIDLGRLPEAERDLRAGLEGGESPRAPHLARRGLGRLKLLQGRPEEGMHELDTALALLRERPSERVDHAQVLSEVGRVRLEMQQLELAQNAFAESIEIFRDTQEAMSPAYAAALVGLGRAQLGLGRSAEALPHFEQAAMFWRGFDGGNPAAAEASTWLGRCRQAARSEQPTSVAGR
jgi:tetratricopeptide (TPR) repeat protein